MESLVALFRNFGQIFQWWTLVAPWELALRVRLGKRITRLGPGIHLRIPFVDVVHKQSVRLRVTNIQTQTLLTLDRKPLTIGGSLGYSIVDVERLYQTLHHPEDTVENIAQLALASIVETEDSSNLGPGSLGVRATAAVCGRLNSYGLGQVEIRITDFAFVRTYRLLMDQRYGTHGKQLVTDPGEVRT